MPARIAAFPLLAAGLVAANLDQNIRPADGNRFELIVEKTGLMKGKKHLFVFERYRGQLFYDEAKPENSRVLFSLDSDSIVCKDDWVGAKDLKKIQQTALKDMLAAERYAAVSFRSSRVRPAGADSYEVLGTLKIRDLEKPATVRVTRKRTEAGGTVFEGGAVVKMTDYGLKPPSAALGLIGTKDEMTVSFRLRAE